MGTYAICIMYLCRVYEPTNREVTTIAGAQVDEKLLYDTFSAFGVIVGNTPKCMRDPETGQPKVPPPPSPHPLGG